VGDSQGRYPRSGALHRFRDRPGGRGHRPALGGHKAVILANHGLLTVGASVDSAVWWFITMERSCQAQLLAAAAGTPQPICYEEAVKTAGQVGTEYAGWLNFQPLYEKILRLEPGLLA
jgi:ribulose-5-phosphate 4-epimerase/fuculose-1-phosphate aldolase